nr:helix-turn-helix transcriptional regulator [uncultured Chryseobacterium sp.]
MSFFGTNIKRIRQAKGLSQKAFGDLLGLNRGVISSYEEERAEPKIETIVKVAQHFSLNIEKLLTEGLQVNQLINISDNNQPVLFPEVVIEVNEEIKVKPETNTPNSLLLQKIIASVDLVYEFTSETSILPQYQRGDILFLNKADLKKESFHTLLAYMEGNLLYASELQEPKEKELYKIVGYVSMGEKNVFESIFERLERLEITTRSI